jgi:hypothetical protein
VVDLEIYERKQYHRDNMCQNPSHDRNSTNTITYKGIVGLPRRCYTESDVEDIIGVSYTCKCCKIDFSTAGDGYLSNKTWYERPDWMPLCQKKTAYSSSLIDQVRFHRLSTTTSGALASVFQDLHWRQYIKLKERYIRTLQGRRSTGDRFSTIDCMEGYRGLLTFPDSIVKTIWQYLCTNYMLNDAFDYMKTIYSSETSTLAFDATHRFAEKGKAVVDGAYTSVMKSLVLVVDNHNYIVSQAMTTDHTNEQIEKILQGIASRYNKAGIGRDIDGEFKKGSDLIQKIGSDYVEKYRHMTARVYPQAKHIQDNFHFQQLMHYTVVRASANPYYEEVCKEIAIKIQQAKDQQDMEEGLEIVYKKFSDIGGVWSKGTRGVFDRQIERIRKGSPLRHLSS